MARQFVYQDAHGRLYPAHAALALQPGLVPGWYDTDARVFTPSGNPKEQVGNIVTDAGVGSAPEQVLSGLREDHGADTAPLQGVVVTTPAEAGEADLGARLVETEAQLAAERARVTELEAQLAVASTAPPGAERPAPDASAAPEIPRTATRTDSTILPDVTDAADNPVSATASPAPFLGDAPARSRRARKVTR